MKKKQIKVIRTGNKTMVIYSDTPAERTAKPLPRMKQKPMLVYSMGKRAYYIMPNGKIYPIRVGKFWKFIKFVYPRAQFAL